MRRVPCPSPSSLPSLAVVALALGLAPAALSACAADSTDTAGQPATELGSATPAPSPGSGGGQADGGAAGGDAATPPPAKNDCSLAAVAGVADVSPTFVVNAPGSAPPAMTGGTLKGQYKVDTAKVFLPSGSAGLVDPNKSTGTINAWAVFSGTSYRMKMKADFQISSVIGPQVQGADTASQGGFTVSGAALALDHACDAVPSDEAEYSFTDNGGGRATILIKISSSYGDTYLQLDAAKN